MSVGCDVLARPTFLSTPRPHVALASYPRSGNSLTRALVENLTGIATGSDFCRNDAVKGGVATWSVGETMHDDSVWVIKTHSRFTHGTGSFAQFSPASAILLVRDPLHVITSFWSFVLSNERQDVSVPSSTFQQFPRVWDAFVTVVANAWRDFHRFWLRRAANQQHPLLILRYEDLASHDGAVYSLTVDRLRRFLYSMPTGVSPPISAVESHAARTRAECLLSRQVGPRGGYYTPRAKGSEATAYSEEQRSRVLSLTRLELCLLGYASLLNATRISCAGTGQLGFLFGTPLTANVDDPSEVGERAERLRVALDSRVAAAEGASEELAAGSLYGNKEVGSAKQSPRHGGTSIRRGRRLQQTGEMAKTPSKVLDRKVKRKGAGDQQGPSSRAKSGTESSPRKDAGRDLSSRSGHRSDNGPDKPSTGINLDRGSVNAPISNNTLNVGGCSAAGAARQGPDSMRCGISADEMAGPKAGSTRTASRMLHHPFQALACVRQAAKARGLDIREWDWH